MNLTAGIFIVWFLRKQKEMWSLIYFFLSESLYPFFPFWQESKEAVLRDHASVIWSKDLSISLSFLLLFPLLFVLWNPPKRGRCPVDQPLAVDSGGLSASFPTEIHWFSVSSRRPHSPSSGSAGPAHSPASSSSIYSCISCRTPLSPSPSLQRSSTACFPGKKNVFRIIQWII